MKELAAEQAEAKRKKDGKSLPKKKNSKNIVPAVTAPKKGRPKKNVEPQLDKHQKRIETGFAKSEGENHCLVRLQWRLREHLLHMK